MTAASSSRRRTSTATRRCSFGSPSWRGSIATSSRTWSPRPGSREHRSGSPRPGSPSTPLTELPRSVVLVEGTSDEVAVETLAERRGVSLVAEGIEVVPIGGAQAIGRFLAHFGPLGVPLAGLYDVAEEREFARALGDDLERVGFFACEPDLEGELIRALGAAAVEAVAEDRGDLNAFRTLQKQPAWRG